MQFRPVKNQKRNFFCALCSTPRTLRYQRSLSSFHYAQILSMTVITVALTHQWIEWIGLASLFIYWAVLEFTYKNLYRKDLPCPNCGFDATWYRKDVRKARSKVQEYLVANPNAKHYRAPAQDSQ